MTKMLSNYIIWVLTLWLNHSIFTINQTNPLLLLYHCHKSSIMKLLRNYSLYFKNCSFSTWTPQNKNYMTTYTKNKKAKVGWKDVQQDGSPGWGQVKPDPVLDATQVSYSWKSPLASVFGFHHYFLSSDRHKTFKSVFDYQFLCLQSVTLIKCHE